MTANAVFPRVGSESPLADALTIQDEVNHVLDTFLGRRPRREATSVPPMDIYEGQDAFVIRAELPGMRQEEIEVSIHDNILTLRGERKPDTKVKEESYHQRERFTGPFHRSLSLSSVVDTAGVTAIYREGVLEVRLPKKEEARPRTIKVEAA
ncbi:MAG TPA: Hsp20/alpha crystallin family protein [Candidatus Methylomirabilis sp.]|nr:Hsp20/alpha crystallin family protein [Candidatus Methylomirabilis sp.]